MSNLMEMLTINKQVSRSKQLRTFITLQQNIISTTETGETIPVFVWIPQDQTNVVKVYK